MQFKVKRYPIGQLLAFCELYAHSWKSGMSEVKSFNLWIAAGA